jgi:hypothetical protein
MWYGTDYGDDPQPGETLASESERLATQAVLKEAYEEQRLTLDEFESRVGRAIAARTRGELARLTSDIPAEPTPAEPTPAEPPQQKLQRQQKLQGQHARPRRNRRRLRIARLIAIYLAGPAVAVIAVALGSTGHSTGHSTAQSTAQPAGNPRPLLNGPAGCPAGTSPTALSIANALAVYPVYVDPGASAAVPPAQAEQLRVEIDSLDSGRILIAVLTPATVGSGTGEEAALANAIAHCQAGSQGVTMVTTVDSTFLASSYNGNSTLQAVRTALNTSDTYAAGLQEAVKQIAALDPWKS